MTADIISIPRAALHEQVAHRLRQMLVENRIAPGAKLNERELAEVLKVSRTPLREAIKMLAADWFKHLLGKNFNFVLLGFIFAVLGGGVIASWIANRRDAKNGVPTPDSAAKMGS